MASLENICPKSYDSQADVLCNDYNNIQIKNFNILQQQDNVIIIASKTNRILQCFQNNLDLYIAAVKIVECLN